MNKIELLKRVDHLISQGKSVLNTKFSFNYSFYVDKAQHNGFRTASLSFISSLYGKDHVFYKDFDSKVGENRFTLTETGVSILNAIRHEIEQDWLISITQLISAEIFSDFMEMAKHLIDNKYKDPAAVMIGSVLEEHIRRLCKNHGIDTTLMKGTDIVAKKADTMNGELTKAGVYNVMMQKNVTAWLDLRNNAAHGKYDQYKIENVELMYQGVLNFTATIN